MMYRIAVLDDLHPMSPACVHEVVMDNLQSVPPREILNPMVHCWDTHARKMVCGARGQIGSTKHVRDVTCDACLQILGRAPRAALSAVHH